MRCHSSTYHTLQSALIHVDAFISCSHQAAALEAATRLSASKCYLANLPTTLLELVMDLSGTTARALALTCKTFYRVWIADIRRQASMLLENSSDLPPVTPFTRPMLNMLLLQARGMPGVDSSKLLWAQWHMEGCAPGVGYGSCRGMHAGTSGCCIHVSLTVLAEQQELLAAAGAGDFTAAVQLVKSLGKSGVKIVGNAAMRAAALGTHTDIMELLKKSGVSFTNGDSSEGVFIEAIRTGNIDAVRYMSR